MAPQCPEEVDVFTVPHSRMKELVCKYLDMLTATNFSNVGHVTYLLESLIKTFQEFIAHEQIENQFIMKRLKNKLRSLSIQNTAVCNCHKDNRLTDMLKFLQDGYKRTKKSDVDHINYGIQLRQALEDFTETFLPHMAEEEEVFQPLLMQHFTVDELKQLKAIVIQQHFKMEPNETPEKFVAEIEKSESHACSVTDNSNVSNEGQYGVDVGSLPDEILTKVFSYLNPQELCRSAQVSRRWKRLAFDGSLWTELYPVSWAKGLWNAKCGVYEEDTIDVNEKLDSKAYDEDADIDETDDWDEEALEIQHQSKTLTAMCKHLLPLVGRHIKHCDLAYSKGLTNGTLYKVLSLCPNMEYLDVTQTRVSDLGFKGFKKGCGEKLRHLDLSGCLYITDLALQRLSSALGQVPCHMTEIVEELKDNVIKQDTSNDDCKATENDENEDRCTQCEANRQTEGYGSWNMSQIARHCQKMTGKPDCCSMAMDRKFGKKSAVELKCCKLENEGSCSASHDKDLQADNCLTKCCDKDKRCKRVCWENDGKIRQNETWSGCSGCNGCHDNHENLVDTSGDGFDDRCKDPLNNPDEKNEDFAHHDRSWIKQEHHSDLEMPFKTLKVDVVESYKVLNDADTTVDVGDTANKKHQSDQSKQDKNQQSHVNEWNGVNTVISNECIVVQTEILESSLQLGEISVPNALLAELLMTATRQEIPGSGNGRSIAVDKDNSQVNDRPLEFLSLSGCHQITDIGLNCLTSTGGLPKLKHLDLSGCLNVDGEAVSALVSTAPGLDPVNLFYCDNILDGPYADTASGCQNLQCASRFCCRCGE